MTTKETKRRFDLDANAKWLNHDLSNDLLYTCLQLLATYNTTEQKLYLTKANYKKQKLFIYDILGITTFSRPDIKLKKELKKLLDIGIVNEYIDDAGIECYGFPYAEDSFYQLVNKDFLNYLLNTRKINSIRIYVYLLNKFLYKNKIREYYCFTIKELLEVIGYSKTNSYANKMINDILFSFSMEGIINFVSFYDRTEDGMTAPYKRLLFVAQSDKELRPDNGGYERQYYLSTEI